MHTENLLRPILLFRLYVLFFVAAPTYGFSQKSTRIGNLEIWNSDLGVMEWYDAQKACKKLGTGWRLPTIDELRMMCYNRAALKNLNYGGYYWSSNYAGQIGSIQFAFKFTFYSCGFTYNDAWVGGELQYNGYFAAPSDTMKSAGDGPTAEQMNRKKTYRDLNYVRPVRSR